MWIIVQTRTLANISKYWKMIVTASRIPKRFKVRSKDLIIAHQLYVRFSIRKNSAFISRDFLNLMTDVQIALIHHLINIKINRK